MIEIIKQNSRWRWLARLRIRRHIRKALRAVDGVVHAGFDVPGPDGKAMFIACTCSARSSTGPATPAPTR